MRMKYRPYKEPEDVLSVGDVRRCTLECGVAAETFYAVVMSFSGDRVYVKRLHREDSHASRYLIRDVGPTGLEYAMFVDPGTMSLYTGAVGRKMGTLSKRDMRNIRR